MKISVIKIGKPATPESRVLAERYLKRLKPFTSLESEEVKDGWMPKEGFVVTLDERGKQLSSPALAQQLQAWLDNPALKHVYFVIGGPYGLSPELTARSNFSWCLSAGTLQGDLAWIVACEQIYRAFTILKGMPYHHG